MIAYLKGKVAELRDDGLVVDIGAIAFEVLAPLAMLNPRPSVGEEIMLHTHLHVREDGWLLFGFSHPDQLAIFRLLQTVSGIGAKMALAIVNHFSPARFALALANKDVKAFTAVSGMGKKKAERLILELKDKYSVEISEDGEVIEQINPETSLDPGLLAALKQLGYSATEARAYAMQAQGELGADASTEALLKEALKRAMKA